MKIEKVSPHCEVPIRLIITDIVAAVHITTVSSHEPGHCSNSIRVISEKMLQLSIAKRAIV